MNSSTNPLQKESPSPVQEIALKNETKGAELSEELKSLNKKVDQNDITAKLDNLNEELKDGMGATILAVIMAFLSNPKKFITSLFIKEETEKGKSENTKAWENVDDTSLLAFFEEIKETFALTIENTDPDAFREKFEDADFKKILEFQKKSGKTYSPDALSVLWSNKDNLKIKNGTLVLETKAGISQKIDVKNDKTITESIVSRKSLEEKLPAFTQDLKSSLTKHFNNIPAEYKGKIPKVVDTFEAELKRSINAGKVPRLSQQRIMNAIEQSIDIPFYAHSIIDSKIKDFLSSTEGKRLNVEYENLWKA